MTQEEADAHDLVVRETKSLEEIQAMISTGIITPNRMCLLYDAEEHDWYDENNGGDDRDNARPRTVASAIDTLTNGQPWPETRFYLSIETVAPPPQPRLWTIDQARANPDLASGTFLVLIVAGADAGKWYLSPGSGNTANREDAYRYTYSGALQVMGYSSSVVMEEANPPPPAPAPPRISEAGPIRLTPNQLRENMESLSRKQTLVWHQTNGYYKQPLGTGYTYNKDEAFRCTCQQALQYGGQLYELVDQEAAAEILKRKCSILSILGKSLTELLQAAPMNPTGRARILAISGQMPPDTITSYDELKSWVENNCEPKTKPAVRPAPGQPVMPDGFEVALRFSETEHGTCDYTLPRRATANYQITPETIQMACRGQTNMGDVVNNLIRYITDHAWDHLEIETDSDGEYNYEYNDSNVNCDNQITTLRHGTASLQDQIVHYLRQTNPDLLHQLQTPF